MIKKLQFTIIAIISIILLSLNYIYASASVTAYLSANKTSIKKDNEIIITMDLKNFSDVGDGINAYVGTLCFDKDTFEFVKVEGQNGWNAPSYNSANIINGSTKLAATINNFTKAEGNVLKIILKAKKEITTDTKISITNLTVATKISGKTSKIPVEDVSVKINRDETVQNGTKDDLKGEDNTTSKKKLSKAGKNNESLFLFCTIAIVGIIYIKYMQLKDIE